MFFGTYKGELIAKGIIRLGKRYIKGKVIDVGAGSGALMKRLPGVKGVKEVIGVDLAGNKALNIIKGDITCLDFDNKAFDTVLCTDVIEHLNDRQVEQAIKEIARVCKPGGHIILTTLFKEDLEKQKVTCPNCKTKFHPVGHQQVFDRERIIRLLDKHGLKPLKIRILHLGAYTISPILFNTFSALGGFKISAPLNKLSQKDFFIVATPNDRSKRQILQNSPSGR